MDELTPSTKEVTGCSLRSQWAPHRPAGSRSGTAIAPTSSSCLCNGTTHTVERRTLHASSAVLGLSSFANADHPLPELVHPVFTTSMTVRQLQDPTRPVKQLLYHVAHSSRAHAFSTWKASASWPMSPASDSDSGPAENGESGWGWGSRPSSVSGIDSNVLTPPRQICDRPLHAVQFRCKAGELKLNNFEEYAYNSRPQRRFLPA